MFKYIISYDGGWLRDSGDFEWGLFNSYGEAEEAANNAKEEYMNDWIIFTTFNVPVIHIFFFCK